MRDGFRRENDVPVQVGQELDVKIESVGEKGDGVAKVNGFVLFVPGTQSGEQVRVKVTRVLKRVGFAEVVGKGSAPQANEEPSSNNDEEAPSEPQDTENFGEETYEEEQ